MLGGQPRTKRVLHMGCVPKRSHLRGQIRFPQPDFVGVTRIQSGRALPRYMPAYPFPALYMRDICLPAFITGVRPPLSFERGESALALMPDRCRTSLQLWRSVNGGGEGPRRVKGWYRLTRGNGVFKEYTFRKEEVFEFFSRVSENVPSRFALPRAPTRRRTENTRESRTFARPPECRTPTPAWDLTCAPPPALSSFFLLLDPPRRPRLFFCSSNGNRRVTTTSARATLTDPPPRPLPRMYTHTGSHPLRAAARRAHRPE